MVTAPDRLVAGERAVGPPIEVARISEFLGHPRVARHANGHGFGADVKAVVVVGLGIEEVVGRKAPGLDDGAGHLSDVRTIGPGKYDLAIDKVIRTPTEHLTVNASLGVALIVAETRDCRVEHPG